MADYSGTFYLVNGYRADVSNWQMPSVPIYRLYNDTVATPYHYWTRDHGEYIRLGSVWKKEGIAFWTGSASNMPLYRLYNPYSYTHMYTTDKTEYDNLVKQGWQGEGVAFNVDAIGDWPVYRLYNKYSGEHMFTASTSERASLLNIGWTDEGEGFKCFGLPALDVTVDNWSGDLTARSGLFGYKDAQLFRLQKGDNDHYSLVSAYSNLAIGSMGNGQVGELRGAIDDRSQWSLEWISNATVDSKTVNVMRLVNASTGQALALGENEIGSAATLETSSDAWDQRWAMVPWQLFQNRGLYELRLTANTNLALDVNQLLTVDGTNVMVHPANGGNNQKFYLHDNGNGWSLRDISSGKMVDVAADNQSTGANVQIWSDNGSRAQRWRATQHGTTWVNGTQCAVVSLGAANATDHLMQAEANAFDANVTLGDAVTTTLNSWALLPTWATDDNVPVPSPPCLSTAVGRHEDGDRAYQDRFYPSWSCTDAWMSGANSYDFWWRIRYIGTYQQSYGSWGPWHEATSEFVSQDNVTWYAPGIDCSFDTTQYKACQVEMWVRVQGTEGAERVYGRFATSVRQSVVVPTVTISDTAGWSLEGLRIGYKSSYRGGTTYIYVTRIVDNDTGLTVFSGDASGSSGAWDDDGSVAAELSNWRVVGHNVTVYYQIGTELVSRWTWREWSATTKVSNNTGNKDIGRVTTEMGKGRTLVIRGVNLGTVKCYLTSVEGDDVQVVHASTNGGIATFVAEPPFVKCGYWLSYVTFSDGGDDWAVRTVNVGELDLNPCHAFDWTALDGSRHHLLLEVRKDKKLSEEHKIDPDYSEVQLQGRRNHTFRFSGSRAHQMDIEGAFVGEDTETPSDGINVMSTLNGFEMASHVHYRAPSGWDYDVAILSVQWEIMDEFTTVQVSMKEEST